MMLFLRVVVGLFFLYTTTSAVGFIKHTDDCTKYAIVQKCGPGNHFNHKTSECESIRSAGCLKSEMNLEADINGTTKYAVEKCKRIVCYFYYNKAIEDSDFKHCTHVLLGGNWIFGISNKMVLALPRKISQLNPWKDWMKASPDRQVLLNVIKRGISFETLARNSKGIKSFTESAIKILRYLNFSGLCLDLPNPVVEGKRRVYKWHLSNMIGIMRKAFDSEAKKSNKPTLKLALGLYGKKHVIKNAFDLPKLNKHVDFFLLDTHLNGYQSKYTIPHSPLFPPYPGDEENVEFVASYFVHLGASRNKLVIKMDLFGNSYTLKSKCDSSVGAPVVPGFKVSKTTKMKGLIPYIDYCERLNASRIMKTIMPKYLLPYLVDGDEWLAYDDEESFTRRVNFVLSNGYGGVYIAQASYDDYLGKCGDGKFPMTRAITKACGI